MGEIRIKSGNLFDINGNYSAYVYQGSPTCRVDNGQIIVNSIAPYYFTYINFSALIPSGQYTVKCKASANFRAMRLLLTKPFDTGTWNDSYQRYYVDMIKNDDYYTYTFTVDEDFAIGFAISGTAGDTGVIDKIMLNEGSTALPYQPYFLNKPAHQYVNGQFVDIPTHHYTNGRWQGELTSQSPLKFRADGEMLDWRVEGRTSGNLYDIGLSATDYTSPSYTKLTISNDTLSMKLSSESGMTYAIRTQRQTRKGAVTYALDTDCNIGIGIIVRIRDTDDTRWLTSSDTSISGFTYNNVYSGWYRWTPLNNGHPIQAITVPNAGSYYYVGFLFAHSSSAVGNVYSATNIQLLEGTYTADTLPPYEPYGGVGDWDETEQKYRIPVTVNGVTTNLYTDHQLMDGDSIGYATTETEIPLAMGNNTLTVDTAVKPSKVFVKFEG